MVSVVCVVGVDACYGVTRRVDDICDVTGVWYIVGCVLLVYRCRYCNYIRYCVCMRCW